MSTLRIAALAGILLFGQAFAGAPSPEARYQAAVQRLKPCQYCLGINDTPQDIEALEAMWQAIQDWTIEHFNSGRTVEQIRSDMLNREAAGVLAAPTDIVMIGPELYALTNGTLDSTGTAFIVGKRNDRFAVLWDVRHLPESALARFPMLRAWSASAARETCRSQISDDHWRECGPLSGNVRPLPLDAKGRIRFTLDATYGQMAETTVGAQLTIWTWDGRTAEPIWERPYAWNFEDVSRRFDGDLLKYRVSDYWHTLYACGSCVGRQMDWTLRLHPNGIDDLGKTPVVPELDAFDELAWRLFKHQNASDLASPEVIGKMSTVVAEQTAFDKDLMGKDYDPNWFSFGMLVGSKVRKLRGGTELCLVTDEAGPFRIRFVPHNGRLLLVEMTHYTGEFEFDFCSKPAP